MDLGRLAQLVEQLTLNQRVVGSSPTSPTTQFAGIDLGAVSVNFARELRAFLYLAVSLLVSQDGESAPKAPPSLCR